MGNASGIPHIKKGLIMSEYILEMRNITKRFPGLTALSDVSIKVKKNTVHALMGENGAGKSTLMKTLLGFYQDFEGDIVFREKKLRNNTIHDVLKSGISMIHQELSSISNMKVSENIFLGREPMKFAFVDEKAMTIRTNSLLKELNINLNPNTLMRELSTAYTQLVEIAKAISYDSQLIIMDEPTSAISETEVDHLFTIINSLKRRGVTIIYISHKIDEIFKVADEVTVLRDGEHIITTSVDSLNKDALVSYMVGRELNQMYPKKDYKPSKTFLSVRGLSKKGVFKDISFDVKAGEILGISGLMGSGRTEMIESMYGLTKNDSGEIFINGEKVVINSPRDAIKAGFGLLTEDRKFKGLFLSMNVAENIIMSCINRYIRLKIINEKRIKNDCKKLVEALSIKVLNIQQIVNSLSGGNQQKVCLARLLLMQPNIFIIDEPTRGIDVGAKAEIHKIINELAKEGKSIIMISSEMPEILGMSDRIIVIREGELSGELSREEATQERLLNLSILRN